MSVEEVIDAAGGFGILPYLRIDTVTFLVIRGEQAGQDSCREIILNTSLLAS